MLILHITDIANPKGNGVAHAVSNYLKYESKLARVASYSLDKDIIADGIPHFGASKFHRLTDLPSPYSNPDLVIFHEIYKPAYLKLYKECLAHNIKYIIVPHGSLNKRAQKEKRLKKLLANLLLFNKFIKNANAIQFLTEEEQKTSIFRKTNAIISGNGIATAAKTPSVPSGKNLIFVGRYQPYVKGLDLLIDLVKSHETWFRNNRVTISLYGRDSNGGKKVLEDAIKNNQLTDLIKVNGAIYDDKKNTVLRRSYAFIQFSRREGQSMGIIEALASGLPCIVTRGTNFATYVNENRCGFGCDFDQGEIFSKIRQLCQDTELRATFSKNALTAAKKDFLWKNISAATIQKYEELLK